MNGQINHSESEIARHNLVIGRKQGIINLYNKKLEMMISQLGVSFPFPNFTRFQNLVVDSSLVSGIKFYFLYLQSAFLTETQSRLYNGS